MSKYGAKKTKIDDIKFDSQAEGLYYEHLKELERAKVISYFVCHPKYELQPKFEKNGVKYRQISYIADFEVTYPDGKIEVVDVKPTFLLEAFKLKRKLFEYKYPQLEIKCVTYTKKYGWETHKENKERRKKK
jgi:hypothetical protein